jgi:oligoendopeptidase F
MGSQRFSPHFQQLLNAASFSSPQVGFLHSIRHFYYKYYVFAYATGLSSGIALARRVQEGDEARDACFGFLSAGGSQPPVEILRRAGVDLTRPDAIEAALQMFEETLSGLEVLLPTLK